MNRANKFSPWPLLRHAVLLAGALGRFVYVRLYPKRGGDEDEA